MWCLPENSYVSTIGTTPIQESGQLLLFAFLCSNFAFDFRSAVPLAHQKPHNGWKTTQRMKKAEKLHKGWRKQLTSAFDSKIPRERIKSYGRTIHPYCVVLRKQVENQENMKTNMRIEIIRKNITRWGVDGEMFCQGRKVCDTAENRLKFKEKNDIKFFKIFSLFLFFNDEVKYWNRLIFAFSFVY